MTGPRMVPPDEARDLLKAMAPLPQVFMDLAHTAAVLGEQRDAVLARHFNMGSDECAECTDALGHRPYPCATARDLGVSA